MRNFSKKKFRLQIIVLLFSLVTLLLVLTIYRQNDIYNIKFNNTDDGILISWNNSLPFNDREVSILVKHHGEIVKSVIVEKGINKYEFKDVKHGSKYVFEIKNKGIFDNLFDYKEASYMYLDYDNMPDLPLIEIETKDGVMPGFTIIEAPNNLFGSSIKDNNYVEANIRMSKGGIEEFNQNIQMKVRGNTSAKGNKTPYEILLNEEEDLLETNYKDNEYVLLGTGEQLNLAIGLEISKYLGIEWQPKYEYVNLVINDDYKGCYILTEKVKKAEGRVNISDNGFLFENDAYWWNAGSEYFRTEHQDDVMGYTFKYPYKITESKIKNLKKYMNEFEEYLFDNNEKYADYIDIDLFARWLLFQDIFGVKDAGGTNMYLYKYDFDSDNPTSTKVKIGPNWDFDSMFKEDFKNTWSYTHDNSILYFNRLFLQDNFKKAYYNAWQELNGGLYDDANKFIKDFDARIGKDLQESWNLDAERWDTTKNNLYVNYANILEWFKDRIVWINTNIEIYNSK